MCIWGRPGAHWCMRRANQPRRLAGKAVITSPHGSLGNPSHWPRMITHPSWPDVSALSGWFAPTRSTHDLRADEEVSVFREAAGTLKGSTEWPLSAEVRSLTRRPPRLAALGRDARRKVAEGLPGPVVEPGRRCLRILFQFCRGNCFFSESSPPTSPRGWLPDSFEVKKISGHQHRLYTLADDFESHAAFLLRPVHAVSARGLNATVFERVSYVMTPCAVNSFQRADGKPIGKAAAWAPWIAEIDRRTEEGLIREVVAGLRKAWLR